MSTLRFRLCTKVNFLLFTIIQLSSTFFVKSPPIGPLLENRHLAMILALSENIILLLKQFCANEM